MTWEQMIQRKRELGYSYAYIAERSGVPAATVQKVLSGTTKAPRYETIRAIEKVLEAGAAVEYSGKNIPTQDFVAETALQYNAKKQGEYTLKDYYALPDERRVELIDGVIYDMSAPTSIHQLLAGAIHADLLGYVLRKKGPCMPLISPCDVQLDMDDKTMVQPDVMVVCKREKIIRRCIYGAPDLVIEILSPSTRKKDIGIKMHKYVEAGVREYWIIWPDEQKIVTYDLEGDMLPKIYGFDSPVPVAIWKGEHEVDFPSILETIGFMYEREAEEE